MQKLGTEENWSLDPLVKNLSSCICFRAIQCHLMGLYRSKRTEIFSHIILVTGWLNVGNWIQIMRLLAWNTLIKSTYHLARYVSKWQASTCRANFGLFVWFFFGRLGTLAPWHQAGTLGCHCVSLPINHFELVATEVNGRRLEIVASKLVNQKIGKSCNP